MIRRLLQRLDQVVSVLGIYGPQRAFAYALKGREMRDVIGSAGGPLKAQTQTQRGTRMSANKSKAQTQAQSPEPYLPNHLYTHTAVIPIFPNEHNTRRNENEHILNTTALNIFPILRLSSENKGKLLNFFSLQRR